MADVTYYIKDGMLYRCRENDGHTYLRHGPESEILALCPVDEIKNRYPELYERLMRPKNALCQ
jgi:hypothetical protein